jgi:hypothetical protein
MSKVNVHLAIGATVFGAFLATAPSVFAEETQCRGIIGAKALDNIFVPDGQRCVLNGTRAKGSVVVGRGATLTATGVRINGNVQAEGAQSVWLRNYSSVGGSVQIVQGGRQPSRRQASKAIYSSTTTMAPCGPPTTASAVTCKPSRTLEV